MNLAALTSWCDYGSGVINAHPQSFEQIKPERATAAENRDRAARFPAMLIGQRSRHLIQPFRLHRPTREAEAVAIFSSSRGAASYMSGGVDLINRLKSGRDIDDIIYLGNIPDRKAINLSGDDLYLGAGVTHDTLAKSAVVSECLASLAETWSRVANPRIRLKGTIGGNLMARDVSYDFPIVALALGATLELEIAQAKTTLVDAENLADVGYSDLLKRIRIPDVKRKSLILELGWKPIIAFGLGFSHEGAYVTNIRLSVGSGFSSFQFSEIRLDTPVSQASMRAGSVRFTERLMTGLPSPTQDWNASAAYRHRLLTTLIRRKLAGFSRERIGFDG